jgi:glucosamine-6-phosphate deaminase
MLGWSAYAPPSTGGFIDVQLHIFPTKQEMAARAAADGAARIRRALAQRGAANVILATGASQLEMLGELVAAADIDWGRVTGFHLDEYVGLPMTHGASFRRYLRERFVERLPAPLAAFHYLDGEGDCTGECRRVGEILKAHPIDVAFVGIGENGHLAFNDPPADFDTQEPYIVVELDEACRRQQLGEGWFPTLADVPRKAISMSIHQILASAAIICTVPDERKAAAVKGAVAGPVSPLCPASALQKHADVQTYLDAGAASQLG